MPRIRRRLGHKLALALALLGPGVASADVGSKLTGYETEALQLGRDLPQLTGGSAATGPHGLVDAEVAYTLGDYDTAALMLFDLTDNQRLGGPDGEAATFYLGEALYQKGDRGAAAAYFSRLASGGNVSTKYYQPSLLRLVEISIAQDDDATQWLAALDRVSPGLRSAQVPYVRGKYAFSKGKLDEALAFFQDVPKGSDLELQSLYYAATTNVAKKDLGRATEIFTDIIGRRPRSANDRRIVELGQLALGRLYYERDQFSKSIDSYLLVDRRSDLFPDALYEVAWVYVKNKQFDKALRALELLSLSEPQSKQTPTVRILEGNLRIRKAQIIRAAQIAGTTEQGSTDDPGGEYDKANKTFGETHDQYLPSYVALSQMVDSTGDPTQYLAQIAGRSTRAFQITAPIPEAAAQWIADEPEVQHVVHIENDLGAADANITSAEQTIAVLDAVIASGDKTSVYPKLTTRRWRIAEIQDDLIHVRGDLADQELRLVDSAGDLAQLSANRKSLEQQYNALGNPDKAYSDRVIDVKQHYETLDTAALDVESTLDSAQAMAVAIRKYTNEAPSDTSAGAMTAEQKASTTQALDEMAKEAESIETELDGVHKEIAMGRDLAPIGDFAIAQARVLRKQVHAAEDAEHRVLAGYASASHDKAKSQALAALGDRAARIADTLSQTEGQLDQLADQGLKQAQITLSQERTNLAKYKADLAADEAESRAIGGTVLGASFKSVKAKFYDIVIRTDVGSVDVAWSEKEDVDDDLKRFNLSRSRELKQLKDEFHDILEQNIIKPTTPKKDEGLPPPNSTPSASPDHGGTDPRVSPGGDKGPLIPSVKPDKDPKKDPKKAPKGGPR